VTLLDDAVGAVPSNNRPPSIKETVNGGYTAEQRAEIEAARNARAQQYLAEGTKTYQTYIKRNPTTGEVYCGRTSGCGTPEQNIARRDVGHHMHAEGFRPAELDVSSTNALAIRGREQWLIEYYGGAKSSGGTSGNAINGISPRNPKRQIYMEEARKEFGD
jgi:hypothetical protein